MKKYFNYLGIIAAAAMTLVSCAKEADNFTAEEPIKDGGEFTIVANPATKTVATPTALGATIAWDDDDTMNLYHAENGSSTYSVDGEFTIDSANPASGTFTGTVSGTLSESKTYDWYAFYPYVKAKDSPASTDKGYTAVGSKTNATQAQTGSDSKAHLSGNDYPLYGKVTGVAYNETPVFEMHHLCSYLEVVVTNNATEELVVNEVTFTAPEDIIGTFFINFADPSNIQYVSSGAKYTSDTAVLSVTGSTIPVGGSAKYYIGIKPFTVAADSDFKVSVNGYEKTIHTAKANTFQSGKIKTVNFDYDEVIEPAKTYSLYTGSMVEGDYLIVADDVAMKAAVASNRFAYNTVSIVSNSITTNDASIVWHIAPSGEYWTIYNEDAAKYAGGNETKNQGALLDAATDGAKWTITNGAEPTIVNYANTHKSVNATLRRNGTYGFACYGTSTGTMPVLYKLDVADTREDAGLAWSDTEGLAEITSVGVDYELPSLTNPHSVTISSYVSTNTSVATIAGDGTVTAHSEGTTTIKAVFDGDATYKPATVTYELEVTDSRTACATPTFTVAAGTVEAGTKVGINCATDGAIIHYTLDGTNPTEASAIYSALLTIDATTTVKAIAVKDGFKPSAVATVEYTVVLGETTGTITFGSSDVKINAASVTGDDDLGNEWTITTAGTDSFTSNAAYYQVGSSKKPAESITFTTTLPSSVNITSMSAKFGGFSGTAGTVALKVGDTTIGSGSLNATNDVVISSTSPASGAVLTVTVTGISKGVKAYYISYTYN